MSKWALTGNWLRTTLLTRLSQRVFQPSCVLICVLRPQLVWDISDDKPWKNVTQWHCQCVWVSLQVPPFSHVTALQFAMLQFFPSYPRVQLQSKSPGLLVQVAPFLHVDVSAHSSMSFSQWDPGDKSHYDNRNSYHFTCNTTYHIWKGRAIFLIPFIITLGN